ncbi:MAG: biotin--[acetyl-CoA-carboxylase] ligase [Caldilineae bacterium]|nr:MAG: biotin--[acetyl-CoA-carboxylase] ligase [Caldilineae bacterium]
MTPARFLVDDIQHNLDTHTFGQTVLYYDQLDSTNTELKRLADVGAPEGTLVIADEQLAGRGRFERRWLAPPGSSLLTSLLFRPTFLPPDRVQYITMLCALAAVDAIAATTGVSVELKWPNDLLYGGRKLAGLLTELSFAGERLDWVVVGLGLNVNVDFSALVASSQAYAALAKTATSLRMITGTHVPRLPLLQAYLQAVERRYDALKRGETPYKAWVAKLTMLGQPVAVSTGEAVLAGVAEGVDEGGALLLRLPDGRLERVLAGDVTLRQGEA